MPDLPIRSYLHFRDIVEDWAKKFPGAITIPPPGFMIPTSVMMNNPGDGVPMTMLQHVHLVSTYNYPISVNLPLETVADYLLQASTITREVAGMTWKFLDAPPDGSVMLVWQPPQLGTYAASDGYVWADAELAYSNEYRGYTVEMYLHKSGYHPPNETIATHMRRRYRLMPAANPNPNLPPCDPSLWILHYSQTDATNRVPAQGISMTVAQNSFWNVRRHLQQQGQLVRKEFMLNDRTHWPTINTPSGSIASYGSQSMGYPGNVISHLNRTSQQPYLQQQHASSGHTAAPPAKRQRTAPPSHARTATSIAATALAQDALDDDEDYSKGDFMDHMTPRDISTTRFVINHEYMEELVNSPYSTHQIVPVPLGLGRKGELEAITQDFFDAPTESTPTVPSDGNPPRVGRLPPGRADKFRAKAGRKFSALEAEIAEKKKKFNKEMALIKAGGSIMEEEKKGLRTAPITSDFNFDDWIFDGSIRGTSIGDMAATSPCGPVNEVTSRVEAFLGKKTAVVQNLVCLQKGGLEEKIGDMSEGADYDMIDASANAYEQQGESTAFVLEDSITADSIQSIGHTPQPVLDEVVEETTMAEISHVPDRKNSDTGSWVIVGEESRSGVAQDQPIPALDSFEDLPLTTPTTEQPGGSLDTPGGDLPGLTPDVPGATTEDFNSNEFTDPINFANLDSAGDALAGYGEETAGLGLDEHGDLGLDESAFGEAFHASQSSPRPHTDSPAP